MPAQEPGIVQREQGGDLAAQPRQGFKVKVSTVKIVTVQHIGPGWRESKKAPRTRKMKVLNAAIDVAPSGGAGPKVNHATQTTVPIQRLQPRARSTSQASARAPVLGYPNYVAVLRLLVSHRKVGFKASFPIALEEAAGHLFGAAADVAARQL